MRGDDGETIHAAEGTWAPFSDVPGRSQLCGQTPSRYPWAAAAGLGVSGSDADLTGPWVPRRYLERPTGNTHIFPARQSWPSGRRGRAILQHPGAYLPAAPTGHQSSPVKEGALAQT